MRGRAYFYVVFCIAALLIGHTPLTAQWVEDGVLICTESNEQYYVRTVPDGEGGAIVVWRDYRNFNFDIYAQRVDEYGVPLWAADGVGVCTEPDLQYTVEAIPDGAGGAIITWHDNRNANFDVYAQRIDSDGAKLWTAAGVAVCTQAASQMYPVLATDGDGGAIITWTDYRSGDLDAYAQRIDASGALRWIADGVQVCSNTSNQGDPAIVEDGYGGVYIVWDDDRNGNYDIYGQRLNSNGSIYWGGGKEFCIDTDTQFDHAIINDGAGGVICVWEDYRAGAIDIYGTRINTNGNVIGPTNGFAVCTYAEIQYDPVLATDGNYGAIIAWLDFRNSGEMDIYAQRIDAAGTQLWTVGGVPVCTADNDQDAPEIVSDNVGGAIITWRDERYLSSLEIFAQRLDENGGNVWTQDGVAVSAAIGDQSFQRIITDGLNGAIIAFQDYRDLESDISVQRLERNGYWGYPAPVITGIRDIPGDEGGFVNLAWDASRLDVYPEDHITQYTVWRAIDESAAMAMLETGARLADETFDFIRNDPPMSTPMDESVSMPVDGPPVIRRDMLGSEPYYWIQIATVLSSYYLDTYALIAETLFDSTATSAEYHYFQVIAHESDPTGFWVSAVDSGYSVDNLAPCPPLALAGEQSFVPEGLTLTWDPNTEPDLDGYAIYRGVGPGFAPGPGNLLTEPCDTFYFDGDWRWDSGYCYKVAAVDIHDNESECALLCSDGITGGETPAAPRASFLRQNHPNPFNPVTTIRFGLAEPAHVTLRIFDAAGRLVQTLVDEHRAANSYEVTWDGCDAAGRPTTSGVYFYKLNAGAFTETKKMVLLR